MLFVAFAVLFAAVAITAGLAALMFIDVAFFQRPLVTRPPKQAWHGPERRAA